MKIISRECSTLAVLSYLSVKQGSAEARTAAGFWLPRRTLKKPRSKQKYKYGQLLDSRKKKIMLMIWMKTRNQILCSSPLSITCEGGRQSSSVYVIHSTTASNPMVCLIYLDFYSTYAGRTILCPFLEEIKGA